MNCSVAAIVPAAGIGRRFGAPRNKVYEQLGDRPILAHVLKLLADSPVVAEIVVVTGETDIAGCRDLIQDHGVDKIRAVVSGGATRQDSVAIGLEFVSTEASLVVIHDGARPLCSPGLLSAVIASAEEHGAATAAMAPADTISEVVGDRLATTLERDHLRAIQTPQAFRRDLLVTAHASARASSFSGTDDASLVARLGHAVAIVPGERRNLKITSAEDLAVARAWLKEDAPVTIRTGFGYDVHQLAAGRELILGGVPIGHELGLLGHSDADVIIHAVMDALLGAAAFGDIGQMFPNTDPRFAGASSLDLLRQVGERLASAGWEPVNIDATLVLERPKIAPYAAEMRRRMAAALGIECDQVSVKATTNEGLGAVGRAEGAAAMAVATIRRVG